MDEISLGKSKIILLPILLGLIIIFFLKLFSIKISVWILIILLIAMLLVIKPILVPDTSSLASKLSNIKTIITVLFAIMVISIVIIYVMDQAPKSANYLELRSYESFDNNETTKDYGYSRINGGKFKIADEKIQVFKTIRITNTGIIYPDSPTFGFAIRGIDVGEKIKVEVLLESRTGRCPFNFTMGHSVGERRVEFGIGRNNRVWAKVSNSPMDIGELYFNPTGSYDLTVDITSNKAGESDGNNFIPSFNLDRIVFG